MAGLIWSQQAISTPEIGFVQDHANAVRRVSGLAGNFRLGDSIRTAVVSSAFSGSLGMAKTAESIFVFDAAGRMIFTTPAKPGPALFAFSDDGRSALAYLARESVLLHRSGTSLATVSLDPHAVDGEVLSIAQPTAATASMLVARGDRVWLLNVSLASGVIEPQSVLSDASSTALLLNNGDLVLADADGITLRRAIGSESHFRAQLSKILFMRWMGAEWVQISDSAGRQFALWLQTGRERLYQLPEERP
jgi:hypothetical protein